MSKRYIGNGNRGCLVRYSFVMWNHTFIVLSGCESMCQEGRECLCSCQDDVQYIEYDNGGYGGFLDLPFFG